MKSGDADRSARDLLTPGDTRALHRVLRDVHVPRFALETTSVRRCAPNDTSVPRLVRERILDHLASKDVSLEAHTAADMRCISSLFKI